MITQSVQERAFKDAISLFPTGVTVITTNSDSGPAGMTASAVCSLSLEPVQLLVCISSHLPTHAALQRSGQFCVNVLGHGHAWLAYRFATPGVDKFDGVALKEGLPLPVLDDAIAYFVCSLHECLPGGDHSIFIGGVQECGHVPGAKPLLYFERSFGALESSEAIKLEMWAAGGATA